MPERLGDNPFSGVRANKSKLNSERYLKLFFNANDNSKPEIRTELESKSTCNALLEMYYTLVGNASKYLSKIDTKLVIEMIRYHTGDPNKIPCIRLEISFKPDINFSKKKDDLYKKTGRCAEIWDGNFFVIDPRITLQELEDLAQDTDIEHITGEITTT